MRRFLDVLDVVHICLLVVDFSSSQMVSTFRQAKAANGDALCGTSAPNKTLNDIAPRSKCFVSCSRCGSPCLAINYWKTTKLCQLFHYLPDKGTQPDCVVFEVRLRRGSMLKYKTDITPAILSRVFDVRL